MAKDQDGQQALIDTDHPKKAQILKLCGKIKAADQERADAQGKASELRKELGDLLAAENINHFVGGEYDVTISEKKIKVSVKKRKDDDSE